jgi:hypothetical protein
VCGYRYGTLRVRRNTIHSPLCTIKEQQQPLWYAFDVIPFHSSFSEFRLSLWMCSFLQYMQVYDITKRKTFETLQQWVAELKNQGPESIIIAIAGNKSDLESDRQVPTSEAQSYANSIGATFMETSAKTKSNVDEVILIDTTELSLSLFFK